MRSFGRKVSEVLGQWMKTRKLEGIPCRDATPTGARLLHRMRSLIASTVVASTVVLHHADGFAALTCRVGIHLLRSRSRRLVRGEGFASCRAVDGVIEFGALMFECSAVSVVRRFHISRVA